MEHILYMETEKKETPCDMTTGWFLLGLTVLAVDIGHNERCDIERRDDAE